MTLSFDDFLKVEMRVGKILSVEDFPQAKKPAYKLTVDFGPLGVKHTSAQLVSSYAKGELSGRLIVGVTNFPVKKIAGFESEFLILGAVQQDGRVILLQPDKNAELGSRIA